MSKRIKTFLVLITALLLPNMAWGQWETQTSIFYGVEDYGLYAKDSEDATKEYVWTYRGPAGYYGASSVDSGVEIIVRDDDGKSVLTPPDGYTIKKVSLNYSNLEVTEGSKIYVRAVNQTDTTTHYTDPYLMTSGGTLDINLNAEGISSNELCFLIFSNDDKAYSYILNSITITKAVDYHLSIGDVPLTGANVNSATGAVKDMDGFYFAPAVGSSPATLTLENVNYGASLTGIVWSGDGDLKIQYSGNNTINTWSGAELNAGDDGYCILAKNATSGLILSATNDVSTLTLTPSNGGAPESNNSRKAISGFSNVTLDSGWGMYYTEDYSAATATSLTAGAEIIISKGVPLDITIADVIVTSGNALNITGDNITGTVSYDAENKILTLNGASIIPDEDEGESYGIRYTGTANLTISLKGTDNIVKGIGGCGAIGCNNTTSLLTFTNGNTEPCSLLLEAENTPTIDGFSNVNTGLHKIDETILGADQSNIYQTTITSTILGGKGTSDDPLLIESKEDLAAFAQYVNSGVITTEYVKLNDNINCSGITGFMPIGNSTHPFTGTFTNSNNYTISNLTCTTAGADGYIGLFGVVGSNGTTSVAGSVSNLTLENCSFSGGKVGGAIAGYLCNGTINNCKVINSSVTTSSGDGPTSAGIAGESFGTITNCTISGCTITASTTSGSNSLAAGGVAGSNGGTIRNCEVTGTTEHPTLIKSINSGSDGEPDKLAGGIVGYCINDNSLTMIISYNNVKGVTTVDSEDSGSHAQAGAIIGHCPNNTNLTLANNFYEYTVKTIIINGDDEDERTGYEQRGNGDFVLDGETNVYTDITANNGAVMNTKALTLIDGVSYEGCESYDPLSDVENRIFAIAPGQTVDISLFSDEDDEIITAASLVYTPTGGSEQTVDLENNSNNPDEYNCVFVMPDADATLNASVAQTYDLWIGETQVTSVNAGHILGEGNTKVTFAVTGNEDDGYINTLTLNGAALTVPVKVGLSNLTIDIQGTNSITTDGTCIQNVAATGTPSLIFKSTNDVVGSLTLKNNDVDNTGVISENFYSNNTSYFTISRELALIMLRYGNYTSDTYYFTAGEVHDAQLVPSYGVQVNNMQIYEGNAEDVLGNGKVSFDKESSTLTLDNASSIETISTSLSTLNIELVGSNSLFRGSDGSILNSSSGEAVTINLKSTGATKGSLTMETQANSSATLKGDNVTLTPVDPVLLLSNNVTENQGTLVYGVSYGLTVAGVTVSNVNASNVLGDDETATVVFTPANNTVSPATPATLTLNGLTQTTADAKIVSGLDNLTIEFKGSNTLGSNSYDGYINSTNETAVLTLKGLAPNEGDYSTLGLHSSNSHAVIEGFASVVCDGAYMQYDSPIAYNVTNKKYENDYGDLTSVTVTTEPHYPLWIYRESTSVTCTQVAGDNKTNILGTTSSSVAFDGTNTLTLVEDNDLLSSFTVFVVSALDALTIKANGSFKLSAEYNNTTTTPAVKSLNPQATLTIAKADGASSGDLAIISKAGKAISGFASLTHTGLLCLTDGASYDTENLQWSGTEAAFATELKKPTIKRTFPVSGSPSIEFINPNANGYGGTLKYKRTYIDGTETVNDEDEISGSSSFTVENRPDYFEVWVEANGSSSEKLYACRLDVKDMTATYGGTVPAPEFLPKSVEGVTVSGYSLGDHTEVAATVTEGNITLTGAGRQELDAFFSIPDGVEYIKTYETETPQTTFYLDVKPEKPTLSKAAGTYTGTQNVTITNLTPNATAWYYTYEGEEPANPNAQAFPADGVDISSSKTLAVYYRASYEDDETVYLYGETTKVDYIILADPELTYKQGETAVTTATWTLGKENNTALPVLQNTHSVAVTYESDNTAVATVANDGTVTVVGIGTATITATSTATDVYAAGEASYALTVNRQLNVSFSASNEWATYYGTENLATPEGFKVYQVTTVNGSTVTISEIGYIPANTAVLLQNVSNNNVWSGISASAYTDATTTFPNNILKGTAEEVSVSSISGGTVYVLYNNMFKRATGGAIPANRGYLVVSGAAGARLNIVYGGEATGVHELSVEDEESREEWYDLQGRRIEKPTKKGLYIRNGKKTLKR